MKFVFSQSYLSSVVSEEIKLAGIATGHWRSKAFDDCLVRLPLDVQKAATTNYQKMLDNPQSVGMKNMPQTPGSFPSYSAQIGRSYRALAIKVGSYFVWYWIGTHEQYNRVKTQNPPSSVIALAQNIIRNKGPIK